MDTAQFEQLCAALPIFPLPRAVLMQGTTLPLHVFEPRYRALVAHCMAGDGVMGIGTLRRDSGDANGAEIWPEIGIGKLAEHQAFPDGRSNIVLSYVGRGHLVRELQTDTPFRIVEVQPHHDDLRGSAEAIAALRMLVLQIGAQNEDAAKDAHKIVALKGATLVDSLAARLFDDDADQRRYLATDRVVERVNLVQDRLAAFFVPPTSTPNALDA